MRRILSPQDGRILKLVEFLYDKDELFMGDLCTSLNVSSKTLKRDIEQARLILFPIDINVSGNKGVKIVIPSSYSIVYIYSALLASSPEYNLLEKLFLCETYTVEQLSEELFLSSSSLRRMISRINVVLQEEGMEINLSPLQITGDEQRICTLFTYYVLERYYLNKTIFTEAQIAAVKALINFTFKQYDVDFELECRSREQTEVFILVQLIRRKNNHFFVDRSILTRENVYSDVDTSAIREQLKDAFDTDINNQNLLQFFAIFLDGKWSFSYNQLVEHAKINNQLKKTKEKFEELIDNIAFRYNIEQTNREELLTRLCNSRMIEYGTHHVLYEQSLDIVNHFCHDYFEGIEFIRLKLKEIFQDEGLEEYKLNDYIRILIIYWDDFVIALESEVVPLKIGFIYNTEEKFMKHIQNKITYRFKKRFDVKIMDCCLTDIESIKNQCDLILTNIPGLVIPDVEVLCFPTYPREKDWSKLETFYSNFYVLNQGE
ncbi:MAG: helix-turn-helix domain-containing protein [Carnobacterium sp.]|uniref:helix-turn-helix domain-containing protein n=1 Tax=Carnobacterium sp. TaxID=48221 RepID=UPI00257FDF9B|nr:helix-turn-helix domain-containing protein [Carnobacterium sp.]MBQ6485380.1 helix-turn-helix domain-containing protein [Carnobacterium sp.]